jgi:biopolymer transport protein TolR
MLQHPYRRRRRLATLPEVSLVPLIDTALTLLVIFMVTTPMMQNSIKVSLPQGNVKEAGDAKQELVVYIDEKGQLFFNGLPITLDRLTDDVKKKVALAASKTIFVKADQKVPYGNVIKVVDHLKMVGGVQYVALATAKLA